MTDPATLYSEAKFLAALEVVKCNPEIVDRLGEATVGTICAALVIAANDCRTIGGSDPEPESADALTMGA